MKRFIIVLTCIFILIGGFMIYPHMKYRNKNQYELSSIKTENNNEIPNSKITKDYISYSDMMVQNLSEKQKNKIIEKANKILNIKSIPTVINKTNLIVSGETKNDYISMAPYLWENSKNPNKYIVKDGVDNPERLNNNTFDSVRLNKFIMYLDKLSIAYKLTGDTKYSNVASKLLKVWFIDPSTKMNPNMKYAEIFKTKSGKVIFTGSSMISSVPLINVVNDLNLLGNSINSSESYKLKSWFNKFSNWLLDANGGNIDKLRINNHGTWLDAELATFYDYAGNRKMAIDILKTVGPDAINPQIQSSGKIPSALVRTKSLDYTEYNLEAFITLANLGQKYGLNIWDYKSENGGSIKKALNYVTNYLAGKTKWNYKNISGKNINETGNKKFITYLKLANMYYKNKQYSKVIEKYNSI